MSVPIDTVPVRAWCQLIGGAPFLCCNAIILRYSIDIHVVFAGPIGEPLLLEPVSEHLEAFKQGGDNGQTYARAQQL